MTIELANQGNDAVEDIWFGVADQLEEDVGRFLEGMRPQFFTDGDIETYYDLDDLSEDPEFIRDSVGLVWVRLFSCGRHS